MLPQECTTLYAAVSGESVGYRPAILPPANTAPMAAISHSGELKPQQFTDWKGCIPRPINAFATLRTSLR